MMGSRGICDVTASRLNFAQARDTRCQKIWITTSLLPSNMVQQHRTTVSLRSKLKLKFLYVRKRKELTQDERSRMFSCGLGFQGSRWGFIAARAQHSTVQRAGRQRTAALCDCRWELVRCGKGRRMWGFAVRLDRLQQGVAQDARLLKGARGIKAVGLGDQGHTALGRARRRGEDCVLVGGLRASQPMSEGKGSVRKPRAQGEDSNAQEGQRLAESGCRG